VLDGCAVLLQVEDAQGVFARAGGLAPFVAIEILLFGDSVQSRGLLGRSVFRNLRRDESREIDDEGEQEGPENDFDVVVSAGRARGCLSLPPAASCRPR
jgi:hypothetical protein